ncbi:MAG: hypothetical protein LBJ96_00145 [Holosporaceae bacterium]|jgi:hypothetical protein|nr:hypothetical protein [Holosporaceae bacterium]
MLLNVCKKIDEYEKSKYERLQKKSLSENELFFISIKTDGIYLNNVKIIDKKAELQFAIFMILIDLYVEEFFSKEPKYILISQICSKLKFQKKIVGDEKQIRTAIYYIRASIKAVHKCPKTDSVIESQKWKGYRLSKSIFLRRF